jgi:ribosome-binding factor A
LQRLNEQFKRELMDVIRLELKDPRVSSVTVTSVSTAPDLAHARVLVTSIAPETERDTIMAGLIHASPFLRTELSRRLSIRRVPELVFEWDKTLDHARRIEQLLAEVRASQTRHPDD